MEIEDTNIHKWIKEELSNTIKIAKEKIKEERKDKMLKTVGAVYIYIYI